MLFMVSCMRYKVDRGAWYKEKVQAKWPHGTSVLRMAMLRPPHGWECCLQPKTLAYITKPHEEEENHRNTLLSTNTYQFLQQSNSWTHKLTSWRVPNLSKAGGFCFPHNLRTSLPIKSTLLLEQSLCPAMSTSSPPQGHPALLPWSFPDRSKLQLDKHSSLLKLLYPSETREVVHWLRALAAW